MPHGAKVLDLGCGTGVVGQALRAKACQVVGVDTDFPGAGEGLVDFYPHDLANNTLPVSLVRFSHVLLLDVVEHMPDPEAFVANLRKACNEGEPPVFVVSTGNVAFCVIRLVLLLGAFNYGARGILDRTHKRLFTFSSLKQLFEEHGFQVEDVEGIPAPFPLALGDSLMARLLLDLNRWLIRVWPSMFAYQIVLTAKALPSLTQLLANAVSETNARHAIAEARIPHDR